MEHIHRMKCELCDSELSDSAVFCPFCGTKQNGKAESSNYEYAAFISYRYLPADKRAAVLV